MVYSTEPQCGVGLKVRGSPLDAAICMVFLLPIEKILPMLLRKRKMPDGSFFDTTRRIFLHLLALFYAPHGAVGAW
jgi:hypothetical protein